MSAPAIRGYCPGAHRPMMSGDGLVLRIRPFLGEITAAQALALADLGARHGSGVIEATSRGNLQLRGVRPEAFEALLAGLGAAGLLDADEEAEARRNVTLTPFRERGGAEERIAAGLAAGLADAGFAGLPGKFGFVVDGLAGGRVLGAVSGDVRIEGAAAGLIVRADGAAAGRLARGPDEAVALALAMARWFLRSGGVGADGRGRMRRHLAGGAALPPDLAGDVIPLGATNMAAAGPVAGGLAVAASFGQFTASGLRALAEASRAPLRVTPFRTLFLPGLTAAPALPGGLVTDPGDPTLRVVACPGAPLCPQGEAPTRDAAERLAPSVRPGGLVHVSGCRKGCAHPRAAAATFVGRGGAFDLVRAGAPWDEPDRRDIPADRLAEAIEFQQCPTNT